MRREGRVRGKPTSKTRQTGRCRSGKTRCRSCRDHPVEKSRAKRLGRHKRFAADVLRNPSLAEFRLQPSLRQPGCPRHGELDEVDAVRVGIFAATVNSVIEAAFARGNEGHACTPVSIHGSDHVDVPFVDAAFFHRELGMFENALEGSERLCEFSEDESWSDVELEEDDDDWTMVDDHDE